MGRRLILDTENDNLLEDVTRSWIVGFKDLDTKEIFEFNEGDLGWIPIMDDADLIVGHNILQYDFPVLYKLFKWRPKKKTRLHDTLVMSRAQNYKRFSEKRHSLEAWGEFFGDPKIDFHDFSKYTPE